jgi:hypothetical protein
VPVLDALRVLRSGLGFLGQYRAARAVAVVVAVAAGVVYSGAGNLGFGLAFGLCVLGAFAVGGRVLGR